MSEGSIQRELEDLPSQGASSALASELEGTTSPTATDGSPPTPNDESSPTDENASVASQGIKARWQELPSASRRLVLWSVAVLTLACLARGASALRLSRATPEERFEKFVQHVSHELPAVLYGEDTSGQEIDPHEVKIEFSKPNKEGTPTEAELNFQEVASSSSGLKLITRYRITYAWRGTYWHCVNLNCSVQRPELSKLDRMNFSAVIEQESVEKAQHLANSRRRLAEEQLSVQRKLGKLLRSGNQF